MHKNRVLIALGVFIFLLPFLGIPNVWKTLFTHLSGIIIFAIATMRIISVRNRGPIKKDETPIFVDNVTVITEVEGVLADDQEA